MHLAVRHLHSLSFFATISFIQAKAGCYRMVCCVQALCGGDRLAMLLERAFLTRDELLFKVLRNLSQQGSLAIKAGFLPYMDRLAQLMQVSPPPPPPPAPFPTLPCMGRFRLARCSVNLRSPSSVCRLQCRVHSVWHKGIWTLRGLERKQRSWQAMRCTDTNCYIVTRICKNLLGFLFTCLDIKETTAECQMCDAKHTG